MDPMRKRFRAFISYSQRDKAFASRLHRALESYRVPAGIAADLGPKRTLGRFFRDDDEMGASLSLGAALDGALDDAENLIVICTPASARSKWVDAEVRRFKSRHDTAVFAVIADGVPNAADPDRECFAPALKLRFDAAGNPTGQPDEPRAPDLQREGFQRIRAQLAAGLLGVPFDDLWQRDRRRARRNQVLGAAAGCVIAGVLGVVGFGWLSAQRDARIQAAQQAIAQSRIAVADGRVSEGLARLAPFLAHSETKALVDSPLRTLLGWVPDPYDAAMKPGIKAARLRDATVLLDAGKGVFDVSDVGLRLERLVRSHDGRRLIAVGDQRVVVFDTASGKRLAQVDNAQAEWFGHAFEAPSGLIVVTGALVGPTNGSVWPLLLSVSADGKSAKRDEIAGQMFMDSAAVTPACDALLTAVRSGSDGWAIRSHALAATGFGDARPAPPVQRANGAAGSGAAALAPYGTAFAMVDVFGNGAVRNPFAAAGCKALAVDDGFVAGQAESKGASVLPLEPMLVLESTERWRAAPSPRPAASAPTYLPACSEAKPCPVVGGRTDQPYVLDTVEPFGGDQIGAPPEPRWLRAPPAAAAAAAASGTAAATTPAPAASAIGTPIYFEHRVHNSGHQLIICRNRDSKDMCLSVARLGEDHQKQPFLRSPDRRYLFWPFGGAAYDLDTLRPLTAALAIPQTKGALFDFDTDRPAFTLVNDGRLVTFAPPAAGGEWTRSDDQRASPRFGILSGEADAPPLLLFASVGSRQYLVVRRDGVLARLDAANGSEVWRLAPVGLGEITDVQLNVERSHVLLMGKAAWRMFRLADGFAQSGLLAPPETVAGRALRLAVEKQALQPPAAASAPVAAARAARLASAAAASTCRLADALGADGSVLVRCGRRTLLWQPRLFTGDLEPQLKRLTCTADVKASTLDTIRRCYVAAR